MQQNLRLPVLLVILMSGLMSMAYNVKGIVTDSIGEPESFATIRIYHQADSVKPAALGTADIDGKFNMTLNKSGKYTINIASVGKSPVRMIFEVSVKAPTCNLGHIETKNMSTELGEVTVIAAKPLISKEIDRIGYDVQADDDSKTIQLDEMLKRVPMVSVDPDGTIKVKGSTSFKIYKNGRPNNSFSRNAKDIFKAIPASMIKKIEVITDPGAREDAEGTSAILNIVTVENTVVKGVMGNAGLDYQTNSDIPTPNIWLSGQIDKVTLSAYGGYNHLSKRSIDNSSEQRTHYLETGNSLYNSSKSTGKGDMSYFGIESSWEPDSLNLLSVDFNGYYYNLKTTTDGLNSMTAADGSQIYSYRSITLPGSKNDYFDLDGSINYQRLTQRKGETFTLSYRISTTSQGQNSFTRYEDMLNMPVPYSGIDNKFRLNFIEHTAQFDWERPLNSHNVINTGLKYIYRQNHSRTTIDYIDYNDTYSNFIHHTQVAAVYADYRLKFDRWGARAGVRYEYSHLSAKYKDNSQEPFGSDLNDIVPNASVMFNINDANTLKLSYSSSISRPGISYLNPAVTNTPTSVSQGNPNLGSARNQDLSLNYSLMGQKYMLDFTTSYKFTNNAIIEIQDIVDDITYSGFDNQGHNRTVYLNLYGRYMINEKANISLNASTSYNDYRNDNLGIRANGWDGWFMLNYNQTLPWKLRLGCHLFSWLGNTSLYNEMKPQGGSIINHHLSLQRSFLKEDRLTVRLRVSNPFGPSRRKFKSTALNTPVVSEIISSQEHNQSFGVTVSYRFGSFNAQVKKVNKTIQNDDLTGRKNE